MGQMNLVPWPSLAFGCLQYAIYFGCTCVPVPANLIKIGEERPGEFAMFQLHFGNFIRQYNTKWRSCLYIE